MDVQDKGDILVLLLSVNIGRLTNIVDDTNPMNISKKQRRNSNLLASKKAIIIRIS